MVLAPWRRHVTSRRLAVLALVLAVGAGAVLVFTPGPSLASLETTRLAHLLVQSGVPYYHAYTLAEFTLNVALFVPGSLAAAVLWPRVRWWEWVVVGLLVSLSIELTQYALLASRTAQVKDLVSNTAGAGIGAGLAVLWRHGHHDERGRLPTLSS
jgi:glycopeptide antibiotics resistance protein